MYDQLTTDEQRQTIVGAIKNAEHQHLLARLNYRANKGNPNAERECLVKVSQASTAISELRVMLAEFDKETGKDDSPSS